MNHGRDENPAERPRTKWRKSSFSNGTGGNCVEVALWTESGSSKSPEGCDEAEYAAHKAGMGPLIALRDSKDPDGPKLYFTRSEFAAFRRGLVAGEFDDLG